MKRVRTLKKWGIYELTEKEQKEYGFSHAVIHPDTMGAGNVTARDSDWECNTLAEAESWIKNY